MSDVQDLFVEAYKDHAGGRVDAAFAGYQAVLERNPDHSDALHLSALIMADMGDVKSAIERIKTAITVAPDNARNSAPDNALYHANLGRLYNQDDQLENAARCYRESVRLNPDAADVLSDLSAVLLRAGQFDAALDYAGRALAIKPDFVPALFNRGVVYKNLGDFERAVDCFQGVEKRDANFPDLGFEWAGALLELASANRLAGHFDKALRENLFALKQAPDEAAVHGNLAVLYQETGRMDKAFRHYHHAIRLAPDNPEFRRNRGMAYLQVGDFENGWMDYRYRWQTGAFQNQIRDFQHPLWQGEDIRLKTLLVHAEQGYGDSLQFARFIPHLQTRAGHIVFECQPPLLRLLSHSFKNVTVIARGQPLPDFAVHVPLLDVPGILYDRDHAEIPDASYVSWPGKTKPGGGAFKVGLAWKGNPGHPRDGFRSMPFTYLKPLLEKKNIDFFSLQMDGGNDDIKAHGLSETITDLSADIKDFADTAALVNALDLVITVDSAVAHLAGSMGKPVWVMLSSVPEWRWQLKRTDSPWYPSLRLFRQRTLNDWAGVVDDVRLALAKKTG